MLLRSLKKSRHQLRPFGAAGIVVGLALCACGVRLPFGHAAHLEMNPMFAVGVEDEAPAAAADHLPLLPPSPLPLETALPPDVLLNPIVPPEAGGQPLLPEPYAIGQWVPLTGPDVMVQLHPPPASLTLYGAISGYLDPSLISHKSPNTLRKFSRTQFMKLFPPGSLGGGAFDADPRRAAIYDQLRAIFNTHPTLHFTPYARPKYQCDLVFLNQDWMDALDSLSRNTHLYPGLNLGQVLWADPYLQDYYQDDPPQNPTKKQLRKHWFQDGKSLMEALPKVKETPSSRGKLDRFLRKYAPTNTHYKDNDIESAEAMRAVGMRLYRILYGAARKKLQGGESREEALAKVAYALVDASQRCPDGIAQVIQDLEIQYVFRRRPSVASDISEVVGRLKLDFINHHAHPGYSHAGKPAFQEPATEIVTVLQQRMRLIMGLPLAFHQPSFPQLGHVEQAALHPINVIQRFFQGGSLTYQEPDGDYKASFEPFNRETLIQRIHTAFLLGRLPHLTTFILEDPVLKPYYEAIFVEGSAVENPYFTQDPDSGKAYKPALFEYILEKIGYLIPGHTPV